MSNGTDPDLRIDPAFSAAGRRARARRRRRIFLRAGAALGLFVGIGLAAGVIWQWRSPPHAGPSQVTRAPEPAPVSPSQIAPPPDPFRALVNLPRDPLRLRLAQPELQEDQSLPGPADFAPERAGPLRPDRLRLINADLSHQSSKLALHAASRLEDFALYQAQRSRALSGAQAATPARDHKIYTRAPGQSYALAEDQILWLATPRSGVEVLTENGVSQEEAQAAIRALQPLLPEPTEDNDTAPLMLPQNSILALRFARGSEHASALAQLTLYTDDLYCCSLALGAAGQWVRAADPWGQEDLAVRARAARRDLPPPQSYLDALYTSALQSGLSDHAAGNLVVMVAQRFALDRKVGAGDHITLLLAGHGATEEEDDLAQVLFVGLGGSAGREQSCYVMAGPDGKYLCAGTMFTPRASADDSATDDEAVRNLVSRIVHVESGGRSDAKNPLSSALGPGQFIISTWLHMIKTYHPELMQNLSRQEVLDLRMDPALSVEMVFNLTRQNRAYLVKNGFGVTSGRLYLAHFLGPEGAVRALGTDPDLSVEATLGSQVVDANPFLRGKSVADLIAWAETKMTGKAPTQAAISLPGSAAYTRDVDQILDTAGLTDG